MCSFDWGLLANWITAIATIVAVYVAYRGVETWKAQLRSQGRHSTALEIAAAAGSLHVEFFNSRALLIEPWEEARGDAEPGGVDMPGMAIGRALSKRYNNLHAYIMAVHNLRGKALAVLGQDCANALEALAKKARELNGIWDDYCAQRRLDGNADVHELRNLEILAFFDPANPTDRLSVEFEAAFQRVLTELKPDLQVRQ